MSEERSRGVAGGWDCPSECADKGNEFNLLDVLCAGTGSLVDGRRGADSWRPSVFVSHY